MSRELDRLCGRVVPDSFKATHTPRGCLGPSALEYGGIILCELVVCACTLNDLAIYHIANP